jgi:BirA family biotin operon repressor/biotin-[acetyl-CoA-carboxylase] ligase
VAVGIGVNCRHHPAGTEYAATDLTAAGAAVTAETLFAALSGAMVARLQEWGAGFAPVRTAWLRRAGALGTALRVRLGAREFAGQFETLDENGRLVLRLPDGTLETIAAGDVFPIAPAVTAVGR